MIKNPVLDVEEFYEELFTKIYFTIDRCAAECKKSNVADKHIFDKFDVFDGKGYYETNG